MQTNPGRKPGPLMKIASGGELARFMLALKVVLADQGSAPTLVFDEIDTGAGGAVADAMGQRLARLASRVQVLAVTHAPQVAARARGHFRIAKYAAGQGPPRRDAGLQFSKRKRAARKSPVCWPAQQSPTRRGRPPRAFWRVRDDRRACVFPRSRQAESKSAVRLDRGEGMLTRGGRLHVFPVWRSCYAK